MNIDEYEICDASIKGKQGLKCLLSNETGVNLWRRCLGHVGISRQVYLQKPF